MAGLLKDMAENDALGQGLAVKEHLKSFPARWLPHSGARRAASEH